MVSLLQVFGDHSRPKSSQQPLLYMCAISRQIVPRPGAIFSLGYFTPSYVGTACRHFKEGYGFTPCPEFPRTLHKNTGENFQTLSSVLRNRNSGKGLATRDYSCRCCELAVLPLCSQYSDVSRLYLSMDYYGDSFAQACIILCKVAMVCHVACRVASRIAYFY